MSLQPWPEPLPESLAVFQLQLDVAAPIADADWALLDADEGARAQRLRRHADRVRFVCTRAALRRVLGQRLKRRPQALAFSTNRFGKPALAGGEPLHFNVSHAGSFALLALSAHLAVGVDIERRDGDVDVAALQPLTLSPLELQQNDEQRVEFFDCWTAKEAVLKALGLGAANHLRQLAVLPPQSPGGRAYQLLHDEMAWPVLTALRLAAPSGYAAALAWHASAMQPIEGLDS